LLYSCGLISNKDLIEMNKSEKLAELVLNQVYPTKQRIVLLKDQSHGEHDFNIFDQAGRLTAIVEVTGAIHQDSKLSVERMKKNDLVQCDGLNNSWLLMAHNPDPKWMQNQGVLHLAVLEEQGQSDFNYDTQFGQNKEVAKSVTALVEAGVENGGSQLADKGSIGYLLMRGESTESYSLSSDMVIDVVLELLRMPDNVRKLTNKKYVANVERHFFVEIDSITHPSIGDCMSKVGPPTNAPDLENIATDIWVAMSRNNEIIIWRGSESGWHSMKL